MKLDLFEIHEGKKLRCGYTTGSCATGAAKAAVKILESGQVIKFIEIDTPANIPLKLEVLNSEIKDDYVSCAIKKDAGDDPDSTDGILIYAKVTKRDDSKILIDGGQGIGRITRKGLFGEIGQGAINPVPRQMIESEIRKISSQGYNVEIFAPEGVEIGKKTFNKNIGIEGGISIIGTKGIVYPMSKEALLKTIYLEVDMVYKEDGPSSIILVPGNYGENLVDELGINKPKVKMSNYIGESLLYVYNKGFKEVVLLGHIGKFAKLSIGIFNTHSRVCDCRMEAFIYYLSMMGAPRSLLERVDKAITAEEALEICIEAGYQDIVRAMEKGAEDRVRRYLKDEDFPVKVRIYSMERGLDIC